MKPETRHAFLAHRSLEKILSVFLLSLLAASVLGQTVTGGIEIRVIDANGAAVPGATVIITRRDTGDSQSATTSADGLAVFRRVPLGLYDIKVVQPGFKELRQEAVQIGVSRAETITLTLANEIIILPLQEEEISALPNLNNDLTPLLQVVPGSIATGPAALGKVIIDGKGNEQRTLRLDGVDFNVIADLPSNDSAIDAVQSLQKPEVSGTLDTPSAFSGAFPAMVGPGTGSVVDTPTYKSERGRLKKSLWKLQLFEEYRNDKLNARNFFDFDGRNGLRRSRFGGKVGTPLDKRDHKFLFFAYDGLRGRTERNVYEAIPLDAVSGGATGPLAQFVAGYLPPGTLVVPGSLNPDFVVARRRTPATSESNAWDIRFDYYPFSGAKTPDNKEAPKSFDLFTFRFTRQGAENIVPDGITGRRQRQRFIFANGVVALKLVRATKGPREKIKEFGHNFRFGFNETRVWVNTERPSAFANDLSSSLITVGGTVSTRGLPGQPATVPVASLGGLAKGVGRGLDLKPVSYTATYDYSRPIKEEHELFAGFEARLIRFDFDRLGGLTYAFPNTAAMRLGSPATVTYLSDLSGPSPFSIGTGPRQARQEYYMGYFQMASDFFRANAPVDPATEPAVRLTYGVRYDYFGAVRERDNRAVVVDPLTGQILPQQTPVYRTAKLNFQPRFGFVYRFDESPRRVTILRGGFGVYSGVPRTGDLILPIESDRFSTGITGGTFPANPADIANRFITNPDTRQFQPVAFARDFKVLERAYKWDAQLTRTIEGYDLSVLYSGNIGRNLPLANVANQIATVTTNPDPSKPAIVVRQFDVVRGGQVFQPFGEFFFRTGGGHSSYNGLTLLFKRNVNAVSELDPPWNAAVKTLNIQYTLSRSVGNVSGTVASNPFDLGADFGVNTGDIRHSFKINAVYDLWGTKAGKKPDDLLLGWKIMPALKVSSGFPLTIRVNRPDIVYVDLAGQVFATPAVGRTAVINTPGGGETGGARVPDRIPGVNPYLRNGLELLNPAAFAIPAPGKFGNVRRGTLRGPAIIQLDLGVRRNLYETTKLFKDETKMGIQFQVDFYNIFNRANFFNPTAPLTGLLGTSVADNQLQPGVPFTRVAAGNFGIISAADTGRLVQFSLSLRFNEGFTK